MKITNLQLKQIIEEETKAMLKEGLLSAQGDSPRDVAQTVRDTLNIKLADDEAIRKAISKKVGDLGIHKDDWHEWEDAIWNILTQGE